MEKSTSISVRVIPAEDLIPARTNSRKHSPAQVAQIRASIEEFGFTKPILEDSFEVVAGHGARLAALAIYADGGTIRLPGGQELPAGTVPVISCAGWTEAQRRAYVIADNKIAENSEWDDDLLRLELRFLDTEGFDLGLTGFDEGALAAALGDLDEGDGDDAGADPLKVSLADRFGIAPFSVLNAREGWWQDRKRAWLALGIRSEVGRGENLLAFSDTINEPDPKKRAAKKAAKGETEDLRGGLTHRTTPDPYRAKAKNGKRKAATFGQDLMRGEHKVGSK